MLIHYNVSQETETFLRVTTDGSSPILSIAPGDLLWTVYSPSRWLELELPLPSRGHRSVALCNMFFTPSAGISITQGEGSAYNNFCCSPKIYNSGLRLTLSLSRHTQLIYCGEDCSTPMRTQYPARGSGTLTWIFCGSTLCSSGENLLSTYGRLLVETCTYTYYGIIVIYLCTLLIPQ